MICKPVVNPRAERNRQRAADAGQGSEREDAHTILEANSALVGTAVGEDRHDEIGSRNLPPRARESRSSRSPPRRYLRGRDIMRAVQALPDPLAVARAVAFRPAAVDFPGLDGDGGVVGLHAARETAEQGFTQRRRHLGRGRAAAARRRPRRPRRARQFEPAAPWLARADGGADEGGVRGAQVGGVGREPAGGVVALAGETHRAHGSPGVRRKPNSPQYAASTRTDPPVSLPSASNTMPATAAAERCWSRRSCGRENRMLAVAVVGFSPVMPWANSCMCVLPARVAPWAPAPRRLRCRASASAAAPGGTSSPRASARPPRRRVLGEVWHAPERAPGGRRGEHAGERSSGRSQASTARC